MEAHRWDARNLGETPSSTEGLVQPPPTSTPPSNNGGGGGGGGNNSLYLYTFLITLLILFGVSCGIVARSIVLRRRFRMQIQSAIDNGMALPARVAASRAAKRGLFGERPVMHEVWLDYGKEEASSLHKVMDNEAEPWRGLKQPVSAVVLCPSDKPIPTGEQPVLFTREVAAEYFGIDLRSPSERFRDTLSALALHSRREARTEASYVANQETLTTGTTNAPLSSVEPKDEPQTMALGIMIAMPDPLHPRYERSYNPASTSDVRQSLQSPGKNRLSSATADGEVELPDVALGVIESDWTGKPSLAPPPSVKKEAQQRRHTTRGYSHGLMSRIERERAERDMVRRLRRTFD
ncbi:hypothetical protein FRB95_008537 [Tulasnella sp. JGI-2019a]|nr:hypothetical protein FRB95_008537 [Tulasnella sp. JGI-2019a]